MKLYKIIDWLPSAKNSLWLISEKIIRIVFNIFIGAWVARYLGPNEFGIFAYVMSYIAFFQVIIILGLDALIIRDVSRYEYEAPEILGTSLTIRFIVSIVLYFFSFLIAFLIEGEFNDLVFLTMICGAILILQPVETIDIWFQSKLQSWRSSIVRVIAYILSNGFKVYFILYGYSIEYFFYALIIEYVIVCIGLLFAYQFYKTSSEWIFSLQRTKSLLSESWPFIISSLSIIVYMRIDQVMIKHLLGERDLGIYSAALPISSAWSFLPMVLTSSFGSYISKLKSESEERYIKSLYNIFRLYSALSMVIIFFVYFSSDFIILKLYGEAYLDSVYIIKVHIFSNLFLFLGVAQSLWIVNEKKSKLSMYKTFVGCSVSIVGNLILLPIFGVIGAAVSAVFAQMCSAFLSNIIFSRKIFILQVKAIMQKGTL